MKYDPAVRDLLDGGVFHRCSRPKRSPGELPPVANCEGHSDEARVPVPLGYRAAATMLNWKSFSSADATEITMESWTGSSSTPGRQVTLRDLTIGDQTLANLKLLAIDLTPLERSCQKRVDGVLGADLIEKFGLTIDLKNHVVTLRGNQKAAESDLHQLQQHLALCEEAFNRSDEKTFEQCLDPDILFLTSHGDFRGRKAVMKHLKETYFGQNPPVSISITPLAHQAIGSVIWIEYDMSINFRGQLMRSKGTALYQKSGEKWLMSNMNNSVPEQLK
ncbi:MAG TPA: nuclear transport factor 2 family protein [Candidatus Angelobacter sp.]|nr:nuclear transport factor 2 family protein [Candidatus Angelobacter sp.]